jgi:hypothetical protein
MALDVEAVVALIQEIDREDSIDWGMLNIGEEDATRLLANSVIAHFEQHINQLQGLDRDYVIVAAIAKLTIENFVLNLKLAQAIAKRTGQD